MFRAGELTPIYIPEREDEAIRDLSRAREDAMIIQTSARQRFKSAKQLMSYLGLTPSEYSSGERTKRSGITKTGNRHARRILIESAWAYRYMAKVTPEIQKRQENVPYKIRQIAWDAQVRLCKRYRIMIKKGKPKNVVVVSVARELAGFMWAIAPEIETPKAR